MPHFRLLSHEGERERAKVGAGDQRRKTDTTADLQGHGLGAGLPGSGGATDSVRGHQQVVMKHVLDQDLRMDLVGEVEFSPKTLLSCPRIAKSAGSNPSLEYETLMFRCQPFQSEAFVKHFGCRLIRWLAGV